MGCDGNNATPPSPAIAPGGEEIDVRAVAERVGAAVAERGSLAPGLGGRVAGFDAPFFQAGLAGYSDAAMRLIARRHGCPLCVTEALLDRTLLAGGRGFAKADLGELEDNIPGGAGDTPLVGQIMGSDPREMAAAALKMVEQGVRADRAYRMLAYADGAMPAGHLRLPGGEQLGRTGGMQPQRHGDTERKQGERPAEADPASRRADAGPSTVVDRRPHTKLPTHSNESPLRLGASVVASHDPTSSGLGFASIDINLACPVKKIASKARGGHWLAEPEGAIRIIEGVREALPAHVPVTLKVRRSFDDTPEMTQNFLRIARAAFDIGVLWITVHARTVEQKYIGPSRWDLLRDITRELQDVERGRYVFGSGDVWDVHDIFRMLAYTGVSAVSVARGCIGNPWIFRQARDMMAGRPPMPPTIAEQRGVLLEHFDLALATNARTRRPEDLTARNMRKFAVRFAAHHPRQDDVRKRFIACGSMSDWHGVIDEWYVDEGGRSVNAIPATHAAPTA
ncbi:MAG: tRNA-dihydrouridine synthase family protein [Phycisphaerales bacterium]|jgi:tRNA-dihydrouridine synthase|nr:tRNA-dihydrouridine synthase family protein [Phycisphaerales bacterium]